MGHIEKNIYKDNPIAFVNERTKAIDEAYKLILEAFKDYVSQNELTNKEIEIFKDIFRKVYQERKAIAFIENKLSKYADELENAVNMALRQLNFSDEKNEDFSKILYYKNKKRLISNEQY